MAHHRPSVGQVRSMEQTITNLQRQLEHQEKCTLQFGKEIECIILAGSRYDYDGHGKKFDPFPPLKIGDIIIVELWGTGLGGSDPTGVKFAARVNADSDKGRLTVIALSSYVPFLSGNDFFAFDSKSTRTLIR